MITGVASALGVVRVVLNDRYNNHIHVSWCTFLAGGGENSAGLQRAEDVAEGEWRKALGKRKEVEQERFNYVLGR